MNNELAKIESLIYEIRGQKVMFDRDLAKLYGVETRYLNKTVKRNIKRFPADFMFQLTRDEWENLMFQFGTSSEETHDGEENLKSQIVTSSWGGIRKIPHVFTEQGIAMLSSVLNSDQAVDVNIQIMRIFVRMRHYAVSQGTTSIQIADLRKLLMLHIENSDSKFSEYDETIKQIVHVLNNLIEQPPKTKRNLNRASVCERRLPS